MNAFSDVLGFLGVLVRFLGLLFFGVAAGWFTLDAYRKAVAHWQLQTAIYLGFFAFIALMARYTSAGSIGAFTLGISGALLYWGIKDSKNLEVEIETEEEE